VQQWLAHAHDMYLAAVMLRIPWSMFLADVSRKHMLALRSWDRASLHLVGFA